MFLSSASSQGVWRSIWQIKRKRLKGQDTWWEIQVPSQTEYPSYPHVEDVEIDIHLHSSACLLRRDLYLQIAQKSPLDGTFNSCYFKKRKSKRDLA